MTSSRASQTASSPLSTFFSGLNVLSRTVLLQFLHHKGGTAPAPSPWADCTDRSSFPGQPQRASAGIVHALPSSSGETALLTLQEIRQGLERTVVGAGDGTARGGRCRSGRPPPPAACAFIRTMMSGACRSIRRVKRLLRLITRRYRSLRSEVAKRPPSSCTMGRSSAGNTGNVDDHPLGLVAGDTEGIHHPPGA